MSASLYNKTEHSDLNVKRRIKLSVNSTDTFHRFSTSGKRETGGKLQAIHNGLDTKLIRISFKHSSYFSRFLPLPRRLGFHQCLFVCLFVSRIYANITQPIFTKFSGKAVSTWAYKETLEKSARRYANTARRL